MNRLLLAFLLLAWTLPVHAGEDDITVSPRKTFTVVQHWGEEGVKQTLRFAADMARAVILEEAMPWPALYHVSPDERWMLRVQKSGSGDNISFLYRVEPSARRVRRMEEQVGALAFAYLARVPGLPRNLYHTGIEFGAWDLKRGLLRFTASASDTEQSGSGFHRPLVYHLREHTITAP